MTVDSQSEEVQLAASFEKRSCHTPITTVYTLQAQTSGVQENVVDAKHLSFVLVTSGWVGWNATRATRMDVRSKPLREAASLSVQTRLDQELRRTIQSF